MIADLMVNIPPSHQVMRDADRHTFIKTFGYACAETLPCAYTSDQSNGKA